MAKFETWGWSALVPGKGYLSDDKYSEFRGRWWSKDLRSCWVCVFDTPELAAKHGIPVHRFCYEADYYA